MFIRWSLLDSVWLPFRAVMLSTYQTFWKSIWSLQVPGTMRHFIWRASHEVLPTRCNLWIRKVVDSDRCLICNREEETIINALWECSGTADVWGGNTSPLKRWPTHFHDFWALWSRMSSSLQPQEHYLHSYPGTSGWDEIDTIWKCLWWTTHSGSMPVEDTVWGFQMGIHGSVVFFTRLFYTADFESKALVTPTGINNES